ncbi:MAG TPA: heparan-alpha-glucosaminide N-acetyltransferase domain-containing protein [Mucilaginibacter sp.]|nr:heparan-alpha-glucosaminide N-acetyltransferase domain-containing protein [Mucilaginibacter sp.]
MTTAAPLTHKSTVLTEPGPKQRIASIDILRGLVMVIMAIDHVRDFYHYGHPEPTDLSHTDLFLFFTRWITHFCAPTFVCLSGMSAYLAGTRRTPGQLSSFLIKRGFWLILIEFVVVDLAISLDPTYHVQVMQVIWVIGASMILLGLLVRAPRAVIGLIGIVFVFGHNIFDIIHIKVIDDTFAGKVLLTGYGFGDFVPYAYHRGFLVAYALLPWAGLMMIGYVFGSIYAKTYDAVKRRKILLYSGLGVLAFFFIFRFFNIYGDPSPWASQKTFSLSIISFFNVTKYPPSLLYMSMTVGTALIFLALTENAKNKLTSILFVYGNVPFFYYICHWYMLRLGTVALFFITGHNTSQIPNPKLGLAFQPDDMGFNLAGVYLVWFCIVFILYFPCRWYSKYKRTHAQWWLSYL